MGYYTRYELEIIEKPKSFDEDKLEFFMFKKQKGGSSFMYAMEYEGGYFEAGGECKWYEHDSDMQELSKEFPELVFKLSGEGEESGDIWVKYYKGGKCHTAKAVITVEPYDEKKLK